MEKKAQEISRLAAVRWFARLRAPDCTESERKEFERWLQASPDHALAYIKAEKVAQLVTQASRNDRRFADLAKGVAKNRTASNISQWRAASVLVAGTALALFGLSYLNRSDTGQSMTAYHNSTKQQQRYVLEDGSTVYLDVDSSMTVKISKSQRAVNVLQGRAFFEVTHNSQRPFLVDAGNVRTTDLGTKFEVSLSHTRDVQVTLVDGAIHVAENSVTPSWHQTLLPGEQVLLKAGAKSLEKQAVDAAAVTSWSSGRLVFKGTPLSVALDELNRYSDSKIVLGDASLASLPVGGNFIAGGDSTQVVDALAAVFPLRAVRVGSNEIVLFQRH